MANIEGDLGPTGTAVGGWDVDYNGTKLAKVALASLTKCSGLGF